ncbi:MAG: HDOD domain-containing protein [Syntrophobacteraceae bacterium]
MEINHKIKILQRIADNDCLASPSLLLLKLIELASDETASVSDLSRIIEQDPALSARLIKLSNTSFYARSRKVSTVSQAVLMMGFNKIRAMALSLSLRASFPFGKVGSMDYEYFWKASLYRALIAQEFARTMPSFDSLQDEEAFTAALILEIGMLMLYEVTSEELKDSFPGDAPLEELIDWEEKNLGINHRQVGRIVLSRWRFPESITESQRHFGSEALKEGGSLFCAVLESARSCTEIFFGKRDDFGFFIEASRILGLAPQTIHEILSESFQKVEEIAEFFKLTACSADDMLLVMEKANRALAGTNSFLQKKLTKVIGAVSNLDEPEGDRIASPQTETRKTVASVLDAVVHEIRNPLMAIGGFAQRLAKNTQADEGTLKYADIIVHESSRLQDTLNEFMALSEAYSPDSTEGNLVETIDQAIDELRAIIETKNIRVIRGYSQEPVVIQMDKAAMKKALQLLLEALIELIGENPVRISFELLPDRTSCAVRISIETRDWSLSDHATKILSGSNFSSRSLDSGFGLLKAWKIFEAHNGHVEIKTESDSYRLEVHLPLLLTGRTSDGHNLKTYAEYSTQN